MLKPLFEQLAEPLTQTHDTSYSYQLPDTWSKMFYKYKKTKKKTGAYQRLRSHGETVDKTADVHRLKMILEIKKKRRPW